MKGNAVRETRVHAMTLLLESLCGSNVLKGSIVRNAKDTTWKLVTCKRCLALRSRHERYVN